MEYQTDKNTPKGKEAQDDKFSLSAPQISLPKGGGAIRGMGEKFAANPVTGTGSMSVPIATSPGRNGFGPQLSLSYDSGAGNGPFGFGWNLSLPSITRKTDKGLPQYFDAEESDVFILSGAEDLVPIFKKAGEEPEEWELDENGNHKFDEFLHEGYRVRRYRPRVEGLFARIERWTNNLDPTDVHWRSISKDNILTLYGKDSNSRICDPTDFRKIFSWLICETRDDKGNAILYEYKAEDGTGVGSSQANERNRERTANRYIKYIRYGNQRPLLDAGRRPRFLSPEQIGQTRWLFEVVFDYGEDHYRILPLDASLPVAAQHPSAEAAAEPESQPWAVRPDPFSSYRAGFELRTYRRCHRVLMFHNFAELVVQPYLVRSTEFEYADLDYSANPSVETELDHDGSTRFASFIQNVAQSGYLIDAAAPENSEPTEDRYRKHTYLKKSLPPLLFTYSKAIIQDDIRELDAASLENLPIGLDGSTYQWVDLDGEGVAGILTEQANTWFYKPNLGEGKFGPMQQVSRQPSLAALSGGRQQLLDLAGDGQLDLVEFSGPTPGFYERTFDEDWEPFLSFKALPNVPWDEPNLRFLDLNGDGHADVLISEHQVFTWYPSMAEEGFGPARQVSQPLDEEDGPRLVFADGTQSIYLADMCGDGLTALVRIRNGEVCYWPNLGYGRFGAKVTMDNAPWFDNPDQFSQQRIRLADIDGSGATDIIYLHRDGVRLYFNQSGNRWSAPRALRQFPAVDNLSSVMTADLLGNGTACLVWSSPLPGSVAQPLRYIDLMGGKRPDLPDLMRGQKPHLLITVENNLGAKTEIHYAASTKFYLADKAAGTPWITKLPFPVHVVEKVVVREKWRGTAFVTRYSYHHGYFDGAEREFRGFGRVEQEDVENYGEFIGGNINSPYITNDRMLYQPPVKTVTWFHTGAFLSRERILNQLQQEYFPQPDVFLENALRAPDLAALDLSTEEWREALRACKGMMLRQEIYELEVDALEDGEEKRVKLFSTAYHNCHIQRLQPRAQNRHAVFLVTESEAIAYHYELDLRDEVPRPLQPDPRIAHALNLRTDKYGNVLESVAVAYRRLGQHNETGVAPLPDGTLELIAKVQDEQHLAYTENRFTDDISDFLGPDNFRLPLPCEVKTYELTGIRPERGFYYSLAELREANIKNAENAVTEDAVIEILYHQLANDATPQKRCVEHVRVLYFNNALDAALALGELGALGLPYETYKLALTNDLLEAILGEKLQELPLEAGETDRDRVLDRILQEGGYHQFTGETDKWWIRSGIAGFDDNTAATFYTPNRYTDPFGNTTELTYDSDYHLYIQSSKDPIENVTEIDAFDFRVLAPSLMRDINDNLSETTFDILGLPAAMALKGKGSQSDNLENVSADPDTGTLIQFFTGGYDNEGEADARALLGNATARHVYYFGEQFTDGRLTYGSHPACAAGLRRETHFAAPGGANSGLQTVFEYSDGTGQLLMAKVKAEGGPIPRFAPDPSLRWITSGKMILNNKGKSVKQYEPYFSGHHRWDNEEASQAVGVTPILYYDAAGRLIRTEAPDGSYSRVEFTPWHVYTYDQNDTVLEGGNAWYAAQDPLDPTSPLPTNVTGQLLVTPQQRAAWLAAQHAGTPAAVFLDSLGREVISVAHNRYQDGDGVSRDERYATYTHLDAEGKPLWIRDARGNRVMEYIKRNASGTGSEYFPAYDIAGNLLFQHSMDGGDRWMLMDATGQPHYAWDRNERIVEESRLQEESRLYHTVYDPLRRPLEQRLRINRETWLVTERFVYGESVSESEAEAKARNRRGQVYQHYDPSGLITNEFFDFKGNLLEVTRQFGSAYAASIIHWPEDPPPAAFEHETFTQRTQYDALSRMTELQNWHREGRPSALYEPQYNARGLLQSEALTVQRRVIQNAVLNIEYDAKGQRTRIQYGNGTSTRYHYDPLTFRLIQLRATRTSPGETLPMLPSGLNDENVFQNLYYAYDPSGNITEIHDDAYQPVFFRNQEVGPSSRYTYDALYRLIEATGRENYHADGPPLQRPPVPASVNFWLDGNVLRHYTQRYHYDSVGNILQMRHTADRGNWTRNYQYHLHSNRLLATQNGSSLVYAPYVAADEATLSEQYSYDTHGSMRHLANVPDEFRLRWDTRDMIHTLDLGGGGWAYYEYDSNQQRTRKRVERNNGGHTVEERFYLGGMEWYRRWHDGGLVEEIETHHLFVDDQRVLIIEDVIETDAGLPKTVLDRYQYSNHLGSVGLELDGAAQIISYEEYHPYGTTAYQARGRRVQAIAKRYRYTGMERDEESGLSYHKARYYLPWLGTWASCDPIGVGDGLNLYCYSAQNPISNSDPNGQQARRWQRLDPADVVQGESWESGAPGAALGTIIANWLFGDMPPNAHDFSVFARAAADRQMDRAASRSPATQVPDATPHSSTSTSVQTPAHVAQSAGVPPPLQSPDVPAATRSPSVPAHPSVPDTQPSTLPPPSHHTRLDSRSSRDASTVHDVSSDSADSGGGGSGRRGEHDDVEPQVLPREPVSAESASSEASEIMQRIELVERMGAVVRDSGEVARQAVRSGDRLTLEEHLLPSEVTEILNGRPRAAMLMGKFVESHVRLRFALDPTIQPHVEGGARLPARGAVRRGRVRDGVADFFGTDGGLLSNVVIEVTTIRSQAEHMLRGYMEHALVLTY